MTEENEQPTVEVEVETAESQEANRTYHMHVILEDSMKETLKDSTLLAYKMGDIPKPDLVDLINLFITWGLEIQKQKWLERVGYH